MEGRGEVVGGRDKDRKERRKERKRKRGTSTWRDQDLNHWLLGVSMFKDRKKKSVYSLNTFHL